MEKSLIVFAVLCVAVLMLLKNNVERFQPWAAKQAAMQRQVLMRGRVQAARQAAARAAKARRTPLTAGWSVR